MGVFFEAYGRKYGLLMSVGAMMKMAEMCFDGDITNISALFAGSYAQTVRNVAKIGVYLSEGYEEHAAFENPGSEQDPLDEKTVYSLCKKDFEQLTNCAMQAILDGNKTQIETEPVDGKKNETA